MDDKMNLEFSGDYANYWVARLIFEQAQWQIKCQPPGTTAEKMKLTPDILRESAELVFFTMDMISERQNK